MQLSITALYAGIMALFALVLGFQAGSYRGKTGISILYGEPVNMELAQRIRVHENFLENVPLILILMGIIELNGGSATFLQISGTALVIARVAHAVGLKHDQIQHPGRAIGAGGTALIMLAAAGYSIWLGLGPVLHS